MAFSSVEWQPHRVIYFAALCRPLEDIAQHHRCVLNSLSFEALIWLNIGLMLLESCLFLGVGNMLRYQIYIRVSRSAVEMYRIRLGSANRISI